MSNKVTNLNQFTDTERRWTDKETLHELYVEQGLGAPTIGERLGCTKKTVYRWLEKHDIETRNQSTPAALKSKKRLTELYWYDKLSTVEIGDLLDCNSTTVHRWMEKHGIRRRSVGGCSGAPWRDEDALREMYIDEERSMRDIADHYDTDPPTIHKWLKKYGIETRSQSEALSNPPIDEAKLKRLYIEREMPVRKIAKRFSVSQSSVLSFLSQYDIPTRKKSHAIVGSGEDNPNWKGGHDNYYGENWKEQRRACLKRDDKKCRACGISEEEHREEHGRSLDVHHITPFRVFDDYEEANKLENLVTACVHCHKKYEGLPVFPD